MTDQIRISNFEFRIWYTSGDGRSEGVRENPKSEIRNPKFHTRGVR